jgi:3-oxoacyl-[acyl-carrier protein] reductase
MLNDLNGKRVLVTGSSQGIGASVACGFAACGARVALHCNTGRQKAEMLARSIREAGGRAVLVQGDVSDEREARRIVDEAAAALGGLDVLVNNAGGPVRRASLDEVDTELYDQVLDLNARAVIVMSKVAADHMKRAGGGAIVNTVSYVARTGSARALLYAGAKAFVANVTKGMAIDLAPHNIRVNAVSPGVIMTPFHEQSSSPEWLESMRATIPMRRLGQPEECVGVYLFLASSAMSSYITGQTIEVNGGQTMN